MHYVRAYITRLYYFMKNMFNIIFRVHTGQITVAEGSHFGAGDVIRLCVLNDKKLQVKTLIKLM